VTRAAELVATGEELLNGKSLNTHARELGRALWPLGWELARETTVPDDRAAIADAVRQACARVGLVFVTGGLGPTEDDVTREALGDWLRRPLVEDAAALEAMRRRYRTAGREMTPSRRSQARIVAGAAALPNRAGAAPGQRIAWEGKTLFVLPGPPNEFRAILDDHVLPWLAAQGGGAAPRRIFMVAGLGESDVRERLEAAHTLPPGVAIAYCAAPGQLEIRLRTAAELSDAEARARLEQAWQQARAALGKHIYAAERRSLAEAVAQELRTAGKTVAVAESCTGGLLGARLTDLPGSSTWFRGGFLAYANELKENLLGVPADLLEREGAVSDPVARRMAETARARCGADYGLAITGIAGPDGGTAEKPVGLVFIALADANGAEVVRAHFPGDRATNREWSVQRALDLLRVRLAGAPAAVG